MLGTIVALVAVVLLVWFRRQTFSYLTHVKGPPERHWDWTPHRPPPPVHIAAVGDAGDSGRALNATASSVAHIARAEPYDVLLLLGDNVYPSGAVDRLPATVFRPFAPVLGSGTDLFAILGNHDVQRSNGEAQMRALGMPGRWWSTEIGSVLLVGLDSNDLSPRQLSWLERTLAASSATWKIVALHHPPYSAGYQGSQVAVRDAVAPILRRQGVQLVLSGHDHDYQRNLPVHGVTYIVTGAGSGTRRTSTRSFTAVSFSWRSFVDVAVYPDRMVVRAVGNGNQVADQVVLRP
ncbi:MAG: metallophosphoesterase family protein [Actinomycetes bacterium]